MAFAALICAYHDSADAPGGLRGTLPFLGRTLVERQVRLAAGAGAAPIVLMVDQVPDALATAIDRMRSEGLSVVIARRATDAAEILGNQARLLLVGDGLVADRTHLSRLIELAPPALLTLPDAAGDDRYERIDAEARWAGLALIDGELLRRTVAILADWDLQSTLLRHAVQGGARQVAVRLDADHQPIVAAEREADLRAAEGHVLRGASPGRAGWVSRFLLAPVEAWAMRRLMPTPVTPGWLGAGAGTLTGLGAVFFAKGWLWAGLLALILATPADGIADRLAAARLQPGTAGTWPARLLPALAALALLSLAWALSPTLGWGCLALAAGVLAFLFAQDRELRGTALRDPAFLADRKGLTWLLLPFAATGMWAAGLAALALYAAGSFFWVQHQAHGRENSLLQD